MNAIIKEQVDDVEDESDDKLQQDLQENDHESTHLGRGYRHRKLNTHDDEDILSQSDMISEKPCKALKTVDIGRSFGLEILHKYSSAPSKQTDPRPSTGSIKNKTNQAVTIKTKQTGRLTSTGTTITTKVTEANESAGTKIMTKETYPVRSATTCIQTKHIDPKQSDPKETDPLPYAAADQPCNECHQKDLVITKLQNELIAAAGNNIKCFFQYCYFTFFILYSFFEKMQ